MYVCVCMYVGMYVCCVCRGVHVCVLYIYIYIYVCVYIYMYISRVFLTQSGANNGSSPHLAKLNECQIDR